MSLANAAPLQVQCGRSTNHARVNPEKDFVEIDFLETTNRGCSQWTYRCIIEISGDRMKLCIPQVDSDPRPQSFDRMGERETLFVLTREPASNKQ